MNKKKLAIIFEREYQALQYFREHFEDLGFRAINKYNYENDSCNIKILTLSSQSLEGLRADFIYLHEDCDRYEYRELIMPIVHGDHNKIRVVI